MIENYTDENVARWSEQVKTDYKDLTELEKESDRRWARKVLDAL